MPSYVSHAPTSNPFCATGSSIARSRRHGCQGFQRFRLAALMNTPRPRPALRRWTRAWAAGFRAARCRSWSVRDRRAARACCCRCSRRPPARRELVALVDVARHVRRRVGGRGRRRSRRGCSGCAARSCPIQACAATESARARSSRQGAHARPAGRQLRLRRVRRRRGAAAQPPAAAVHDVAAAPTHHRREPDGLRSGRRRADGAELGGLSGEIKQGRRGQQERAEDRGQRRGERQSLKGRVRQMELRTSSDDGQSFTCAIEDACRSCRWPQRRHRVPESTTCR